jgi:dTDP-glucose 4,6-dehydratase
MVRILRIFQLTAKQGFGTILVWNLSVAFATILRFDGVFPGNKTYEVITFGTLAGAISIIISYLFSPYHNSRQRASIEDVLSISVTTGIITIFLTLIRIVFSVPNLPRSIPLLSGLLALIFQFALKLISSRMTYKSLFSKTIYDNTLIYGAGITGRQLAEQMLLKSSGYKPIGFLDDDPDKKNLRIFGRKVLGKIDELEKITRIYSPKILIIAFSGIAPSTLMSLENRCRELAIELKIIPSPFEIVSRNLQINDLTSVSEEDLLGRRPIKPDESDIEDFIIGKKILITGAGGSIGSEIARQISRLNPSNLFLLDRDENALLSLQLSLVGDGLLANPNLILADIRDSNRISEILSQLKPDVVFHTAALKHLAMLERFPEEAIKTNVNGTKNLINAALTSDVKYFVNISTDKAADPISQLGRTKLITERLISAVGDPNKIYISVRFGNVIGSNGSFLNTFRHQIKYGGPIKVTHPDVTRYFMTVSEAVHLVLQSILVGEAGETLILEMGDPVSISAVAKHMINASGKNIGIEYTGLREGEKLHEVLIGVNEKIHKGKHKDILHTRVDPLIEDKF